MSSVFKKAITISVLLTVTAWCLSAEPVHILAAKPPKGDQTGSTASTTPAVTTPATTTPATTPATTTPAATSTTNSAPTLNSSSAVGTQPAGSPASDVKAPVAAPGGPDPALVALGSLSASNLYYAYLTLGTVADGFVNKTYDASTTISIANESIFINTASRKNLDSLAIQGNLAAEDKAILGSMIETYDILIEQARALIAFVKNDKDDGTAYQRSRGEAWKRIVTIFGVK